MDWGTTVFAYGLPAASAAICLAILVLAVKRARAERFAEIEEIERAMADAKAEHRRKAWPNSVTVITRDGKKTEV